MALPQIMKRMPNLVCICIDSFENEIIEGRVFDLYHQQPWEFCDITDVIRGVENLMDAIAFPEATVRNRTFKKLEKQKPEPIDRDGRVRAMDELLAFRGEASTLILSVESRDNASWQGKVYSVEKDLSCDFISETEFIRFINKI